MHFSKTILVSMASAMVSAIPDNAADLKTVTSSQTITITSCSNSDCMTSTMLSTSTLSAAPSAKTTVYYPPCPGTGCGASNATSILTSTSTSISSVAVCSSVPGVAKPSDCHSPPAPPKAIPCPYGLPSGNCSAPAPLPCPSGMPGSHCPVVSGRPCTSGTSGMAGPPETPEAAGTSAGVQGTSGGQCPSPLSPAANSTQPMKTVPVAPASEVEDESADEDLGNDEDIFAKSTPTPSVQATFEGDASVKSLSGVLMALVAAGAFALFL